MPWALWVTIVSHLSFLVEKSSWWCDLIHFFQDESIKDEGINNEEGNWSLVDCPEWLWNFYLFTLLYLKLEEGRDDGYLWESI